MRRPIAAIVVSLSAILACGEALPGPAGASESSEQGSESESRESPSDIAESTDEADTGTDEESFNPLCGEWTSTLVDVERLDEIWLDGEDLVAAGGRALVERNDGVWADYVDFSLEEPIFAYDQVWGPSGDRWVLARAPLGATVYHHDGVSLTPHAVFPNVDPQSAGMLPRELVGRGPDDVWALAMPSCMCFFQPCTCPNVSELLHFDGQDWWPVDTPGQLRDIALTETGVWGVGHGLLGRYDGQSWTLEDTRGPVQLEHVWAFDDDVVWAAGSSGQLLRRSGGVWTSPPTPEPHVIALEGVAADRVWMLGQAGELWSYDGAWKLLTQLADARALGLTNDGQTLMVVGGKDGQVIWQVDAADGTTTVLRERPRISAFTMIADDVDHMLLSTPLVGRTTWRFTAGVWQTAYEELERGFVALKGPVDHAVGVRFTTYHPEGIWQLGENPLALPEPIESGQYNAVIDFADQLWVGGRDHKWKPGPLQTPFVYAFDGTSWTDHSPPLVGSADAVERLSSADGRLFAHLGGYEADRLMVLEGDDWVVIPNPSADPNLAFADIAATAADRLWVTIYLQSGGLQLLVWDGAEWHDAASLWPQLGEQGRWHSFAEPGDGRLWVVSSNHYDTEQLAYFDGEDWTIIDTPQALHGWGVQPLIAVGVDGLFIHDGIYVWRYAFCPA